MDLFQARMISFQSSFSIEWIPSSLEWIHSSLEWIHSNLNSPTNHILKCVTLAVRSWRASNWCWASTTCTMTEKSSPSKSTNWRGRLFIQRWRRSVFNLPLTMMCVTRALWLVRGGVPGEWPGAAGAQLTRYAQGEHHSRLSAQRETTARWILECFQN